MNDDGEIDRKKLGDIIFSDSSRRKCLNKITHPEVYKQLAWEILRSLLKGYGVIVIHLSVISRIIVCFNQVKF